MRRARITCSCTNAAGPHLPVSEAVSRRMLLLALAVGPLLVQRFDLLPATLVAGALLALGRRRDALAGVLFGLGAMAKLYPALLLAPVCAFLIASGGLRRAAALAGAAAATALAVAAPFLALAPGPFLRSVMLYGARPFQIESLPGALALALGGRSAVSGGFGSYNVSLPSTAETAGALLFWIALGALALAAARSGARLRAAPPPDRLRALSAWVLATVAVILCTSKVLSPQFLIWLLPWPAVLLGSGRLLHATLACLALTQAFYPFLYSALRAGHPLVVALLLARNAGLILLALAAACAARSLGTSPAVARTTPPPLEPPLSPNIRPASPVQDP